MMYFSIIFTFIIICSVNSQLTINSDFGKYTMEITHIEPCKGSKKTNLTTIFIDYPDANSVKIINGNYTVIKDAGPVMFKGKLLKWTGKRFEPLLKYKSDNLCEFSSIRQKEFDNVATFASTDESSCTLKKGTQQLKNIDMTKLGTYLLGETYFYGQYKSVLEYFTTAGNIMCMSSVFILRK